MFNTVVTIQALSQSIYARESSRENSRVVWLYHTRSGSRLDCKWLAKNNETYLKNAKTNQQFTTILQLSHRIHYQSKN